MAKILLNVELSTAKASQQIKALETNFTQLAKSLKGIDVNKDLTKQLNALAKAYQAINKSTAESTKETNANARATSAQAKLIKATADAQVKLQRAQVSHTKATKDNTKAQKDNNKETERANQSIVSMLPNILRWQVAMTAVMKPLRLLQDGWASLNETLVKTEDTVISLQRVLSENLANEEISGKLYKIAQEYGQTFENVSEIAENFARTGMSWQDTISATEAAVLALNVAELDAEQASTGLIAILAQFNLEASDLTSVVDKLNKTADNFPVTTDKLLAGLQRTGSTAANANMTLEQTIGLITSLSKATGRSGENIGTALNSLINYSSKSSALDTFASVSASVDKVVQEYRKGAASIYDVWKELSKNINNMQDEQLDLLDQYFKSDEGSQLAQELGAELGELNDDIAGVYSTANTFRKNYFIALLKNIDTASEAEKVASDALGYSQKENSQYMDTYTAKVNTLQAKWEELANDEQGLLGLKKDLVDMGIATLDLIKKIGGLKPILALIGSLVVAAFGAKIITSIKNFGLAIANAVTMAGTLTQTLTGWIGIIGTIGSLIVMFTNFAEAESDVRSEYEKARDSIEESAKSREADIKVLDNLIDEYDNLNTKTELTSSEQAKLKSIVEQLQSVYGDLGFEIDEVTGKYKTQREEIDKLRESALKEIEVETKKEKAKLAYEKITELEDYFNPNGAEEKTVFSSEDAFKYAEEKYQNFLNALEKADSYDFWDYLSGAFIGTFLEQQADYDWADNLNDVYLEASKKAQEWKQAEEDILEYQNAIIDATEEEGEQVVENNNDYKTAEELEKERLEKLKEINEELKKAKSELEQAQEIEKKQNAILDAQQKLWEAIKEAQQDYLLNIVNEYVEGLEEAVSLEEKQNAVIEARADREKAIAESRQKQEKSIADAREKYEKTISDSKKKRLLEAIKAERNSVQQTTDLEEKRLEIEKARIALANAQANRSVKVYNAATGAFEWQTDAKAVKEAQDNVSSAIGDYNSSIESNAWNEVEEAINNGNTDTKTLRKIISKWANQWEGDTDPAWISGINRVIGDATNFMPSAEDLSNAKEELKTSIKDANESFENAVTSANDKLKGAIESLNKYVKDKAISEIKTAISNGDTSSYTMKLILDKWLNRGIGGEIYTWGGDLATKIANAQGVYDSTHPKVVSAQQSVASAKDALNSVFAGAMWNEANALIESGGINFKSINALEEKYRALGVPEDTISKIISVLKQGVASISHIGGASGAGIKLSPNMYIGYGINGNAVFDDGGILNGLGGIKATTQPETVLNPDLTRKILEPSSNAQFASFANSLGLLFGTSKQVATSKAVSTINNNNNSNTSNYTVNGVPISSEVAKKYTVAELFNNFALV